MSDAIPAEAQEDEDKRKTDETSQHDAMSALHEQDRPDAADHAAAAALLSAVSARAALKTRSAQQSNLVPSSPQLSDVQVEEHSGDLETNLNDNEASSQQHSDVEEEEHAGDLETKLN